MVEISLSGSGEEPGWVTSRPTLPCYCATVPAGAHPRSSPVGEHRGPPADAPRAGCEAAPDHPWLKRSEEHTSELQSPCNLVCRLLLEKKKNTNKTNRADTPMQPEYKSGI